MVISDCDVCLFVCLFVFFICLGGCARARVCVCVCVCVCVFVFCVLRETRGQERCNWKGVATRIIKTNWGERGNLLKSNEERWEKHKVTDAALK